MSAIPSVPYPESRPLPPYRGLLAVDTKDFTGLPSSQHGPVSQLVPELVDRALGRAGLGDLRDSKSFPAGTGDGLVFGFDPVRLPYVLWPFLEVLNSVLGEHNQQSTGPRIRLRASVHVGPVPDSGQPGDGNGTPRNDTHRLLDSRPVRAILAGSSERVTHLAAIISHRVYEDVVLAAYSGLHPDRCVEVPATVEGKPFSQRAWLYVPSPSGNLLQVDRPSRERTGGEPAGNSAGNSAESGAESGGGSGPAAGHRRTNVQHVGEGIALMGGVGRDFHYTAGPQERR